MNVQEHPNQQLSLLLCKKPQDESTPQQQLQQLDLSIYCLRKVYPMKKCAEIDAHLVPAQLHNCQQKITRRGKTRGKNHLWLHDDVSRRRIVSQTTRANNSVVYTRFSDVILGLELGNQYESKYIKKDVGWIKQLSHGGTIDQNGTDENKPLDTALTTSFNKVQCSIIIDLCAQLHFEQVTKGEIRGRAKILEEWALHCIKK